MSTRSLRTRARLPIDKDAEARRLWRLTGGMVDVTYCPGMFDADNPDSQGHLYYGNWSPPESPANDGDTFYLDDRHGPLEWQLADELLRVARLFARVAKKLRAIEPEAVKAAAARFAAERKGGGK